ncbi:MAG: condensation domain-containing protein, partial [Tumebacillaceae bacterium]
MKQQVQGFRISPQQRRLWKLCLAQDQQLYVTQMAVLVERHLEENNLQIALQAVLNRHELLRSTFPVIAGMSFPMQVVGEEVHPHLRTLDWCDMTSEEQTNRLEQLFQSERQTPFDLEEGTILRVIRIVISPEKQILLLSAPAFCLDLQGAYQVLRDLLVCAEHGDVPVLEEELPIPYTAVADWWNEMLETDKGEYGRSYWQQMELSHVVNTTLTSESVHEPNGDYRPQTLAVTLDAAHVAQIVQVAERVDASLASSLHTAWQVLVGRMTQLERFIVGTSYDGRMDEETVAVPGLFARYVPFAGRYDKEQTYLQLVEQTEKSMQDGYEWQESFSWELLGFDNAGQRAPYFPIGFDFVELADEENVSYLAESSCIDRFDVRLSALQVADGVQIKLYFDANRYSEQEMQHVLNAYAALLKHAVSAPDRAVAELGLLDESECRQLLASMHDTRVDFD